VSPLIVDLLTAEILPRRPDWSIRVNLVLLGAVRLPHALKLFENLSWVRPQLNGSFASDTALPPIGVILQVWPRDHLRVLLFVHRFHSYSIGRRVHRFAIQAICVVPRNRIYNIHRLQRQFIPQKLCKQIAANGALTFK